MHVLVIEDDLADFDLLRKALARRPGTTLQHARTLSEGLDCIHGSTPFDLALVDLTLPDSDGSATVVAVRAAAPQLPLVVLTGNDDRDVVDQVLAAGAEDYLLKQGPEAQLFERIIDPLFGPTPLASTASDIGALLAGTPAPARAGARLRDTAPGLFRVYAEDFGELIELAHEERSFVHEGAVSERIQELAVRLGLLGADPRDAADIYRDGVSCALGNISSPRRRREVLELAREKLFELLAQLLRHYRRRALGTGTYRSRA